MKITLRKRDSVTSAVLFIFNLLGEYKKEYVIKLNHLIELTGYFDKSEVSVRTGLSRMVKADILVSRRENNETVYELTDEGYQNIWLWNRGLARFYKRYALRQQDWNGQWCSLSVINFKKSEYENLFILEELEECGLREINYNLWITPYDVDKDIIKMLENQKINYLIFRGVIDTGTDPDAFLKGTFLIEVLREKYIGFIKRIESNESIVKFGNRENHLSLLFEFGWDFYDIATSDIMLPKRLLNAWEGDMAVEKMKIIRTKLLKSIMDLFKDKNI